LTDHGRGPVGPGLYERKKMRIRLIVILLCLNGDYRYHPCKRFTETPAQRRYLAVRVFDCIEGPGQVAPCGCRDLFNTDEDCDVDLLDAANLYLMAEPIASQPDSPCT